MKGKKKLDALNKRLGVDGYKSGDKDIKGTFANVKARLDDLENKRQGLLPKTIVIPVQEGAVNEGVWTSSTIHLEEDALELKTLKVNAKSTVSGENLAKGGAASASSHRTSDAVYSPGNAFDGITNNGQGWQSANVAFPHWIMYDWITATKAINAYKIRARGRVQYINQSPKDWVFRGLKLDGVTWVDLDTQLNQVGWGEYEEREFHFENKETYRAYALVVSATNGYQESGFYPVNIDELEFYSRDDMSIELPRNKVKISAQTTAGFIDIGNNFEILNKFSKDVQVKVEILDKAYKLESISLSYMNRPLSDRVSEVEANVHINLNKHNLRVGALLDKKRYKLKDMIIDDFGDGTGIDIEHSTNITHDADGHKVKQTDTSTFAVLTTVKEDTGIAPDLFLLSALTDENKNIEFYVSRDNGVTWTPVKPDILTKINMQPEGKELVVKAILRDGQELHAMSYSWL